MSDARSVKELENVVLDTLSLELAQLRFRPRLSRQEFVAKSSNAVWVVHVGFIRHTGDVDATLDLGVSLPSVEKVLSTAGWQGAGSATVGTEFGNVVDGRPCRWSIRTESDAQRVAAEMASNIAKFGIDWFTRFSDLKMLLQSLQTEDRAASLLMPLRAKRYAIALALASLLQSSSDLQTLARTCHALLAESNDQQLAIFDRFSKAVVDQRLAHDRKTASEE
jgi:hypothetical protein